MRWYLPGVLRRRRPHLRLLRLRRPTQVRLFREACPVDDSLFICVGDADTLCREDDEAMFREGLHRAVYTVRVGLRLVFETTNFEPEMRTIPQSPLRMESYGRSSAHRSTEAGLELLS